MHSHKHTITAMDGMRGLACMMVMFYHMGNLRVFPVSQHGGMLGVMLFFSLSGFLMAYHYLPIHPPYAKDVGGLRYWLSFLVRRFFRVYPAYAVSIALLWVCIEYKWINPIYWYRSFDMQEMYAHLWLQMGRGVFWTIHVELQYYLFLPLLAILISCLKRPLFRLVALMTLWGVCMWYDDMYVRHTLDKSKMTPLLPYMSYFIGGMVAGFIYGFIRHKAYIGRMLWNLVALSLVAILLACGNDMLGIIRSRGLMASWNHVSIFAPLTASILLAVAMSSGVAARIFSNSVMRYLGDISYSLYLLHTLVILWLVPYRQQWGSVPLSIAIFTVSLIAAQLSYCMIERPLRRYGRHLARIISG